MTTFVEVPNGTDVSLPIYVELVSRYMIFAKKSAENIIKLAETLVEAKSKLGDAELQKFCSEVGLEYDGSTYRKLMKIGQEVSRFHPFMERMPNNWTTVYKLAKLEKDKFELVANNHRFTPMMTASEVDVIIGGPSSGEHLSRDLTIDLTGVELRRKMAVCDRIDDLKQEFGFAFHIAKQIARELKASTEKVGAAAQVAKAA